MPLFFFPLQFRGAGKPGLKDAEAEKMVRVLRNHRLRRKADNCQSLLSWKYCNPTVRIPELLMGGRFLYPREDLGFDFYNHILTAYGEKINLGTISDI